MPLPMPLEPPTTSTCLPLKSSSFIPAILLRCVLGQAFVEKFDHQNVVVISPVLLEGSLFMAVLDKAHGAVKPACSLVLAHHSQLNHLRAPARMVENSLNKPFSKARVSTSGSNIHAPKPPLM